MMSRVSGEVDGAGGGRLKSPDGNFWKLVKIRIGKRRERRISETVGQSYKLFWLGNH